MVKRPIFILKPPKVIESITYVKPIWSAIETTLFYLNQRRQIMANH